MDTLTYSEVFAYAHQVAETGNYSKYQMRTILSAKFLHGQDLLRQLEEDGLDALDRIPQLQEPLHDDMVAAQSSVGGYARTLGQALQFGIQWLMGEEMGPPEEIVDDAVEILYDPESDESLAHPPGLRA